MEQKHTTAKQAAAFLQEEIKGIKDKGFDTVIIGEKEKKDRRRFIKVFNIKLNDLVFNSNIERKYINFFILLVNTNIKYIVPDLNIIDLSIKQIAENMEYTTAYVYNCLKVLKQHNLIDYYKQGKNKYIVINPDYFAMFYELRNMFLIQNVFDNPNLSVGNIIDKIKVWKLIRNDKKNKDIDLEVKKFIQDMEKESF